MHKHFKTTRQDRLSCITSSFAKCKLTCRKIISAIGLSHRLTPNRPKCRALKQYRQYFNIAVIIIIIIIIVIIQGLCPLTKKTRTADCS